MSVIYKGLKMPKNCTECIARVDILRGDIICGVNRGLVTYKTLSEIGRPVWCPAQEVKNHGDLIIKHRPPVIESDKEK